MDDDFFVFMLGYIVVVAAVFGLIFWASASDEPSTAVVQCVESRMEMLSEVDGMWSTESERGAMAKAMERFCESVQG